MGGLRRIIQGFTIVELLIVVVIISILTTIIIVVFAGVQQRAMLAVARNDMKSFGQSVQLFKAEKSFSPQTSSDFASVLRESGLYSSTRTPDKSYAICANQDGYAFVAWNPIVDGWMRGDTLYLYSGAGGQQIHTLTNSSLNAANQLTKICEQVYNTSTFDSWTYDIN
jgi:prepilin-type N-terminal cleavage/methylation domain-containing protein